jgi:hypothetical protein
VHLERALRRPGGSLSLMLRAARIGEMTRWLLVHERLIERLDVDQSLASVNCR